VNPGQGEHWVALRSLLAIAAPLLVLWTLGRVELGPYAVFAAFTTLFGRRYRHGERMRIQLIVGAAQIVSVLGGAALALLRPDPWVVVGAAAILAAAVSLIGDLARWTPVGPMFQVFGFVTLAASPAGPGSFGWGALVTIATVAWVLALAGVWALGRRIASARGVPSPARMPASRRARSSIWSNAAMYGVGAALAGGIATALGIGHAGWSMVAVIAGLAGPSPFHRIVRATNRFLGTIVGLAFAALIVFAIRPTGVWTVLLVVALTGAAELVVTRNYALAMIPITPLVLLMGELVGAMDPVQGIADRLIETLVGVVVAIAIALLLTWLGRRPGRTMARA